MTPPLFEKTWGWTMTGRPLNMIEAAIMLGDLDYRRIARTPLARTDPTHRIEISTVFLVQGSTRQRRMPPLYETAVVGEGGKHLWVERSMTFEAALAVHCDLVAVAASIPEYRLALPSPDNLDRWL